MKKNISFLRLEENKGLTLLEILIAIFIFTFVCLYAIFILKNSLLSSRKKAFEKDILSESIHIMEFIENRITNAMINDFEGKYRMNFKGGINWVKFICPFSENKEGDIAKFGIYWKEGKIMVEMIRVDKNNPDFAFFDGFPGAQILGENIKLFSLKYFDGENWKEDWDTETMEEPELPKLVEITILVSKGKIEGEEIEKEIKKVVKIGWK